MGVLIDSWLMKVVLILVSIIPIITADQNLKWEVDYMRWSPDGVDSVVMTVNGKFPGPTIRAKAGETIQVELTNHLPTEGVVIHWHGIRQKGTPWADGTASISQCAINPGESFVYKFNVDRAGTYFYHGHYGMQRSAGLYGMLIVDVAEGETEKFKYDGELDLLLSDWWHKASRDQEVDLSSNPMHWIGEPQTLLINGRGQFNCTLAAHYSNSLLGPCNITGGEQYAPYIFQVEPSKIYRLRIASSTSLASLNLAIGNHKMTVVEADGNYVEPFTVDNMDIYSGETYSVLFTTDQNATQNYWISATVRGREPQTPPALTLLNYYLSTSASQLPNSPPPLAPAWDDYVYSKGFLNQIHAATGSPPPPAKHDRRIVLLNTQNNMDGFTKWSTNSISLALPSTPYLGAIKYNLTDAFDQTSPPDHYSPDDYDIMSPPPPGQITKIGNGIYTFQLNSTIDVILQNANTMNAGVSEIHPWHLHGHDFWVLAYGEGKFTDADEAKFNLTVPPLRNTAVIFPYGWTALRFVADNPGVWAFHCHIEPHLHLGMGVVFAEGVHLLDVPSDGLACGLTAKYFINN